MNKATKSTSTNRTKELILSIELNYEEEKDANNEIVRILRNLVSEIEANDFGPSPNKWLNDINDHRVGSVSFKYRKPYYETM